MTSNMRLYHYSVRDFEFDAAWTYLQAVHFKPVGLWLSVEDDWQRWCEAEEFKLADIACRHEVTLHPGANILRLADPSDIDSFTRGYSPGGGWSIDWPAVAACYDGVIISPYCHARRLARHATWYYAWDCASGCVWDLSAIASVQPAAAAEVR